MSAVALVLVLGASGITAPAAYAWPTMITKSDGTGAPMKAR